MVSSLIIITRHDNNVHVQAHVLFYQHNSGVYDIEINISTVESLILGFVVLFSIIHGRILVVNN